MPFDIRKIGSVYKLFNTEKKRFVNVNYKTRQTAAAAAKNFIRYDSIRNKMSAISNAKKYR